MSTSPPIESLRADPAALSGLDEQEADRQRAKAILAVAPLDPTALYRLGVLSLQSEDLHTAHECLLLATQHDPMMAESWLALGDVHRAMAQYAKALDCYEQAIVIAPSLLMAHRGRVAAFIALGDQRAALTASRCILGLKPDDAHCLFDAVSLHLKFDEASLALELLDRCALALADDGQWSCWRGLALAQLAKPHDAVRSLEISWLLRPDELQTGLALSLSLVTVGRLAEALLILDRLVSLYADCAGAQHQRGQVLFDLGRSEEAKLCFDRALTLDPSHVEAWVDQATTLRSLGHVEQACLALDQALLLAPTHHRARFNLADCHLHLGRFATGWELYEARRLLPTALPAPDVSQPLWDGSQAVQGRRIFVWWEQAIGDSFQFVRYVRELESAGAMVYLSAPASLHAVLSTVSARCTLLDPGQMPAQYDYHCPLQSLPRAFATRVSSIPSQVPYLSAEPSRRLAWKTRLGDAGFKVGVAWSGAVRQAGHGRSFPLKELLPLSQIPGVRLISLQMNAGVEQLADCPPGLSVEVLPYPVDQEGSAFIDTAAIIDNLDLVISCDTSIAHLAGALGVPVWVALKFMPDWRWGVSGTQCAWYPSMRLFRQSLRWHWGPVFYAMNEQLRAQLAATGIR